MNFLLDTNACIAVINGWPGAVRSRLEQAVAGESQVCVSSVVAFELWYGVVKSSQREANFRRLAAFFAGPITLLSFDDEDARAAGTLRGQLEAVGRPIGAYDVLIAGQALRRKLALVAANVFGFRRVKGLVSQNWARRA